MNLSSSFLGTRTVVYLLKNQKANVCFLDLHYIYAYLTICLVLIGVLYKAEKLPIEPDLISISVGI